MAGQYPTVGSHGPSPVIADAGRIVRELVDRSGKLVLQMLAVSPSATVARPNSPSDRDRGRAHTSRAQLLLLVGTIGPFGAYAVADASRRSICIYVRPSRSV